ncbi:hypothetical protein A2917_02390 [Candidatus Nomurabacteria bacterium RIFCSPLOWO2_01_FULL_42_17]|uniref:VanZ-like domain-containing protein n=1 Tax=Candidatus Nomurabacteria bacterium RIFCSPLOWO2_01_FULL_42_17 TaxID=1801780 RepID=A0A1F6XN07_9BACT|nr:MAG: hypothetical protein A2917_02390 [Candidatus Nomurabacteria bacterium RIFCSPLOWO2_01_FULL_42_17]
MERTKLVKPLICLILLILAVNFLANKFYWYSALWWLDVLMHFLGGFWIGLLYLYLFSPKNISRALISRTLFFVLLVGVGWEVFEILVNEVLAQNSFDYLDTLADLILDLSGGLYAILYLWKKQLK